MKKPPICRAFPFTAALLGILGLCSSPKAQAAVITVLDQNFQTDNTIAALDDGGWKTYFNTAPSKASIGVFSIGNAGGNYFLQASGAGGITAPLLQPLAIDSSMATVTIEVDVMGTSTTTTASSVVKMALTSRTYPATSPTGAAFATGADSGIYTQGYGNANTANFIGWRGNGTDTSFVPSPNVKFIPTANVWTNWKMVYSVQSSTLSFYVNDSLLANETGVDLIGTTLNSLWLASGGNASYPNSYDNLKISYETVPEAGTVSLVGTGLLLILACAGKKKSKMGPKE